MLIYRKCLEIANAVENENPKGNVALQTVFFDEQGRVAATDGHLWLRVAALVNEPDLFTADALSDLSPLRAESIVLPSSVVKDFNAACKRGSVDQFVISGGEDGQTVLASVDGKTTRTFLIKPGEVPFPNVEKTIPTKPPMVKVILGVDVLRKLLGVVKGCGGKSVNFTIYGDEEPIAVSARGVLGESAICEIDGAVMPMRAADESKDTEAA
jgi:hypothetical protein